MRLSLTVREQPTGVVLWRGKSLLNGDKVVVIATGLRFASENDKTGGMVQTYILPDTESRPPENIKSGADVSVCGDCIHRQWGTCYVNPGQGVYVVHDGYMRGIYPDFTVDMLDDYFSGRKIRLGAYGDPCAVPLRVWEMICGVSSGWTGYTHQWMKRSFRAYKRFCMASVETEKRRETALRKGWKVFRILNKDEKPLKGEFQCPADRDENKLQCEDCMACSGGEYKGQVTPFVRVHGPMFKVRRFEKMQKLMRNKRKYRFTPTLAR